MIDASIPLGGGNRPDPIREIFGQIQEHKLGQLKQQMYEQELAKGQQAQAQDAQLKQLLSGGARGQDLVDALTRAGRLPEAAAYQKQLNDQQSHEFGQAKKVHDELTSHVGAIYSNPNEEFAVNTIKNFGETYKANVDHYLGAVYGCRNNPDCLKKLAAGWGTELTNVMPKAGNVDAGGEHLITSTDPVTGKTAITERIAKTQSPDSKAADARERNGAGTPFFQPVQTGQGVFAFNARTGQVAPVSHNGQPLVGAQFDPQLQGNIAGAKTAGEAGAKRDFNMSGIGGIIQEAEDVLSGVDRSSGSPVNAALPTGSGIGAAADAIAGAFGVSPKGAAEADKMRAISGALVAKMPRMEGPQSNYDVENYKEMAGKVGDATLPLERRKAALQEVKRLWAKYDKSGTQPAAGKGASQETRVNSLPDPAKHKGYEAEAPDGTVYVSNGTKWIRRK